MLLLLLLLVRLLVWPESIPATAQLIIGLTHPAATELIAANSLSRCFSLHVHMEEIKPAKLIQTHQGVFFLLFHACCQRLLDNVCFHVRFHLTCSSFLHAVFLLKTKPWSLFFPSSSTLFLSHCPHCYIIEEDSSRVCCKIGRMRYKE